MKGDAFGGDFECGFGTSKEGEVAKVGVAYGEVVTDGDVVVAKVFMEYGIHIVEAVLRMFVLVELAHDDASDVGQQASHLHIVEHTIYLAHPHARILHKKDDAWQHQRIEVRTSEAIVDRKVSTHDDALCPTLDIQWMRRHMVFWQVALQHTTQTLADSIIALVGHQGVTHCTVNGLHPSPGLGTEQGCYVAEANDEFGILTQSIKRQTGEQMGSPIATPRTHYRFDRRLLQGPKQVGKSFVDGACKAVIIIEGVLPYDTMIAPTFECLDASVDGSRICRT